MGWRESQGLTSTTWQLVKTQRPLWKLVVRGTVLAGVVGLVFGAAGIAAVAADSTPLLVVGIVVLVVGAWLAASLWMFHAGALAHAADVALRTGTSPSPAEALAATRAHRRSLSGWAAITVVVGWLLSLLRGDGGGGAVAIVRLIGVGLLAAAWSLITFFVVPVIVLESLGPVPAIKRSSRLVKERWGTQIAGNIRIGAVIGLLTILPAIVLVVVGVMLAATGNVIGEAGGGAVFLVGLVLLLVGSILLSVLRAVFGVALYRYASSGQSVGPYSTADLDGAVKMKLA